MQKMSQLIFLYFILFMGILIIYIVTLNDYKENLLTTNTQIDGAEYLKKISSLSIAVSQYMGRYSHSLDKDKILKIRKDIVSNIDSIYQHQSKTKNFINKDLNAQLELMKKFELSEDGYYEFLDTINHENYVVGDKSKLLFVEDRELHFLDSLITHYVPEYLISILISHNIVEEFNLKHLISDKKKNIFIEQTKLTYLSAQEIYEIIEIINQYEDTKELETYIFEIQKELKAIKTLLPSIYKWENNTEAIKKYLDSTHKLLDLSYTFNDEQYKITEIQLHNKRDDLNTKIFQTNVIFFLILAIFSFLMYLFYRLSLSNMKKDTEIKNINEILDKFVVFSKTDVKGVITYVSSAMEDLSGYSKDELIGQNHRILKHEDMKEESFTRMWNIILAKEIYTGEFINKRKDGSSYLEKVTITPELDDNGDIVSFAAYRVDITDQKALEYKKNELITANENLKRLSTIDTLTQIYNRLKLDATLKGCFGRYRRYKKVFSLIIIDIDYFKDVNDVYGHLVGDEILKGIVEIIKNNIRETDIFGRWGGEEFLIICEEDMDSAYKLAEKLRVTIENHKFVLIGKKTISLGIAQIDEESSISDLIKRADDALYYAKKHGRNKSVKFSDI